MQSRVWPGRRIGRVERSYHCEGRPERPKRSQVVVLGLLQTNHIYQRELCSHDGASRRRSCAHSRDQHARGQDE